MLRGERSKTCVLSEPCSEGSRVEICESGKASPSIDHDCEKVGALFFLSHLVTVLTNSLLGRIKTHPDISGRVIKWIMELSEYDIRYQPRETIKTQTLSDFLTEMVSVEVWRVFVDGRLARMEAE